MAIPVAFQSFKAAGIYRIIYDKSTVLNEDTNILRLVVGYSDKGPFNTPVYVTSVSEFTNLYGNGSKAQEKRGNWFHRIAKQCLQSYPILALNLKKFDTEKVSGLSVNTDVYVGTGTQKEQINLHDFYVADIYDTTRFWELDANKLYEIDTVSENGTYKKTDYNKTDYINISSTSTVNDSHTVFIRKAAGTKVSSYNVTVSDWYKDESGEIPEYLANKLDSEISDYFAEIYVFSGKFTKKQIIASETLQNYFNVTTDADGNDVIALKPYILNAYGDRVDTLDALYDDSSSGAVSHYVGSLIPYFKNKIGSYVDLSILFNQDVDTHHMMMSFNVDLLEDDEPVSIDLSCSNDAFEAYNAYQIGVGAVTNVKGTSALGNVQSPVDVMTYAEGTNERTGDACIITSESYEGEVYGPSFSNIPTDSAEAIEITDETYKGYYAVGVSQVIAEALAVRDRFIPAGALNAAKGSGISFPSIYAIVDAETAASEYGIETAAVVTYDGATVTSEGDTVTYADADGTGTDVKEIFVIFDGKPIIEQIGGVSYIVRVEHSCNQEIGTLKPYYLEGYTYQNSKPAGTDMNSKLDWQNFQLSALTEYKGIRTALLNKSEIDYRYIVDTFETYVDSEVKSVLSYLTKEKDSAFLITNFPSVKTFLKCNFNSYTDDKGNFNVQYVVDGYNKKKAHTIKFCLPSEPNGASYCAFYTPLKFSDGYIDDIVPSAGIVSNLFVQKYYTRHPYDIIAGPNYGAITVSGLTGPDYNYSKEELNIIEPFGVNCMVYRPSFGTFINANQTAKQTPKSALSSVNVRELCIYIQDEIEKVLQSYQWEFNNATVRQKIKDKADLICQAAQNNGGIQDFLNVMDESNNTADIIDNEMAVISTHIEPGRGMGKMVQELTLYRTGQMRSAISE